MSLSDVFRDRYYEPGYVYIAGSLSDRVIKIGVTKNIQSQQNYLRSRSYGGIGDWVLLYYVWVNGGGRTEHKARRRLQRYKTMRMYKKDGRRQKGREIVKCTFSVALDALSNCIDDSERSGAWQSNRCSEFEFRRQDAVKHEPDDLTREVETLVPAKGIFNLFRKIDDIELSVRTANCLRNGNIAYVGELVEKSEAALLRSSLFGRRSVNEINDVLAQMGLHLGMKVPGWPTGIVEAL